jgi:GH25 family lysozyme M1 (1,4-beta-N-acetylmuramidase)
VKLRRPSAATKSAPPAARARGADFSSYQGAAGVRTALRHGLDFGIVKLTQGVDYVNPYWREQAGLLRAHGCAVGLYHFLEPHIDGAHQWDHFEHAGIGLVGSVLAVDHESLSGVVPADEVARAFIRRGKQRGYRVGRYGSTGTTMRYSLGEDWRWVAKWAATPPAGKWDVWQFDGSGQDLNVFRGDRAALHAWAAKMSVRTVAKPKARWWIHDLAGGHALGPYRLAAVAPAFLAYAARHPHAAHYSLERT